MAKDLFGDPLTPEELARQQRQQEMPFAIVQGNAMIEVPQDLYIPPDALEVILESFEGPLDLLLYLIRRQNLDVVDIPIAEITRQYVDYVELMKEIRLELAADYLVMAAILAEIKSRMLLPRPKEQEGEEGEDPRAELVRRLQEYERFMLVAEQLDQMPRIGRELYEVRIDSGQHQLPRPLPDVSIQELLFALSGVMTRANLFTSHQVQREALSVRERMARVLERLTNDHFTEFSTLFLIEEGRRGLVVTLLAILELRKEALIELVQNEAFGPIHVKAA